MGTVIAFAGGTTPDGWLLANGELYYDYEYPDLYDAIDEEFRGTTGDPPTSFFITPDLRARTIVGTGTVSDTGRTTKTIGASGGAETHTLLTSEMPSHNHALPSNILRRGDGSVTLPASGTLVAYNTAHNSQFTGGGAAHNNLQPYMALNYIINATPCDKWAGALTPGFYDNQHPGMDYQGNWVDIDDVVHFNSSTAFSDSGGYVLFTVLADKITIYTMLRETNEEISICVNFGCLLYSVHVDSVPDQPRSPLEIDLGRYGVHVIQIEAAPGDDVYFDGVLVHAPATDIWMVGNKTASFSYGLTAGDVSTALFLGAILLVVLTSMLLNLSRGE